jgi:hypothetical protein
MGILMTDKLVGILSSNKVIALDNLPLLTPSKQNPKTPLLLMNKSPGFESG